MPTKFNSPYATAFKSAIKRGTSYNVAVNNIANRRNKNVTVIWNSLFKAGLVSRQKFNGQWIYFPKNVTKKSTATVSKATQHQVWQWFCEWCIITGNVSPEKIVKNTGSQKEFMTFCRKYFGKQFVGFTNTSNKRTKRVGTKSTRKVGRKTTNRAKTTGVKRSRTKTTGVKSNRTTTVRSNTNRTKSGNYRFPSASKRRTTGRKTTTRRYSRAA